MLREVRYGSWMTRFSSVLRHIPLWNADGTLSSYTYDGSWINSSLQGPPEDKFIFDWFSRKEFVSPPISIGDIAHVNAPDIGCSTIEHRGYKPSQDSNNFGSRSTGVSLGDIWSAWRTVRNPRAVLFDKTLPENEHPVHHWNVKGNVVSLDSNSSCFRDLVIDYGDDFKNTAYSKGFSLNPSGDTYVVWKAWTRNFASALVSDYSRRPNGFIHCMDDRFYPTSIPDVTAYTASRSYLLQPVVFDFFDGDEMSLSKISYTYMHYDHGWMPGSYSYNRSYSVRLDLIWELTGSKAVVGQACLIKDLYRLKWKLTYTPLLSERIRWDDPIPHWTTVANYDTIILEKIEDEVYLFRRPLFSDEGGIASVLATDPTSLEVTGQSDRLLSGFRTELSDHLWKLYPSAFYASKEAVDGFLAVLEANHLETISELTDISSLITGSDSLGRLAKAIRRKDPISTAKHLIGTLADAKLIYEYGVKTSMSDAQEIADKARPLGHISDGDIFKMQTYRGKFSYELGNLLPSFPNAYLTARCELRGRLDPNSLLAAVFPYRAAGLLPSLSSFWDLVPWSFVVDWFFNLGQRFEDIDSSIEMLAIDVRYVISSIEVTYPIPNDLLTACGVTTGGLATEQDARLSYYVRHPSVQIPSIGYSPLDFRPPSGIPDWGTALSLVIQLFK